MQKLAQQAYEILQTCLRRLRVFPTNAKNVHFPKYDHLQ